MLWILAAYIALLLFVILMSDSVIFQPHPSGYSDSSQIVRFASANGARIAAMYMPVAGAKFTILYSHGNAEDIGDNVPFFQDLNAAGFSVFAYDYQGYGLSEGKPSERNSYADIDAGYIYLTQQLKVSPEHIIAVGQSLGGAMAVDLASRRKVAGLVVQSSFTSAYRVLTRWPILPFDKFRSLSKISLVNCPVLIIHGRRDNVIAFWNSEALFNAAKDPKYNLWVEKAGHNDLPLIAHREYRRALQDFAATLP
jgi:fermentation-respiration switch protein FrsA (DUF1100 family)